MKMFGVSPDMLDRFNEIFRAFVFLVLFYFSSFSVLIVYSTKSVYFQ